MFSKLTAFLQQAAEVTSQVLAPQLSRPEEFQGHWRAITDCIATDNDETSSVQSMGIVTHLDHMVELLCKEEEERDPRDPGSMGPCLEFVLQHKILDTLHTTAKSDYPSGMRHQVLLFLTVLLGRVERPLLPHVAVHQPIQKQVACCGKGLSSALAVDEVQLLRTLCVILQRDPRLADFFLQDSGSGSKKTFLIAEALLRLVNNQDSLVVMKTYECLLTCATLPHPMVASTLSSSPLPVLLASKLQYHFQLIPPTCHHTAIISCHAGWGVDYATRGNTADHSPATHGVWHVEAFLSWLDYCEQVVNSAQEVLAEGVCEAIHELLLTASLLPKLAKSNDEDIVLSTAVLARSIQAMSCKRLLTEFICFTLGDTPLARDSPLSLRDKLVQQTDHLNTEVCQVTLQLFDILLQAPLPSVIQEMVLKYWWGGGVPLLITPPHRLASERQWLEETITNFLSLAPDHLSSCQHVTGGLGVEQYLVEAHRQVAMCRAVSLAWYEESLVGGEDSNNATASDSSGHSNSDINPTSPLYFPESPIPRDSHLPRPSSSTPVQTEQESVGPLLATLLTKLECLLDQPYEVSLLLTSIFSSLAAFPHPMIDWLFDTHCKHHTTSNVYSVLRKVSSELQLHADRSPGLLVSIVEARRRLAGMETSDLLSMPHNDLLEGAIVLEEFTKEIASILYAKKTSAMLILPPLYEQKMSSN